MSRKNENVRPRSKRGRGGEQKTLYVRACDVCAFVELSYRASFVTAHRRCPNCKSNA